ncbi:GNAT family N-acetyltransferase [archaeon]|nr:GNAT family N-acetyltransferase [archaeon]
MEYKIRKATTKDAKILAELLFEMSQETYAEFKKPIYKPTPKKKFMKDATNIFKKFMKDKKHYILIAIEEEPIGFAACEITRYRPSLYAIGDFLYMQWLFVKKPYRRHKTATKLVEASVKEAKKRKLKMVLLLTQFKSKRNINFYNSLGFEKEHYKLFKVIK